MDKITLDLKNNESRCNRYVGREKEEVQIMELLKEYDLTLRKKDV